jgi:AraC-like DNA-binding protein
LQITIKLDGVDRVVNVGGHYLALNDCNAIVVNPWQEHAMPAQPGRAGGTLLLSIYLDRGWLASLAGSPGLHARFDHSSVNLSNGVRSVVASVVDAVLDSNDASGDSLEHLVRSLASDLLLLKSVTPGASNRGPGHRGPFWDTRIRRAIAYMEAHIQSGLNTSDIAAEACISRAHFYSRFKHCTSLTPHMFANLLRLEAAIGRLPDPELSIEELSAELGFSAPSNFARFFRQRVGITPSTYRRNVLKLDAEGSRTVACYLRSVLNESRAPTSQAPARMAPGPAVLAAG